MTTGTAGWSVSYLDYGYYFDAFTCDKPLCCSQLTYELSSTNTYPPTLITTGFTLTYDSTHSKWVLVITDRSTLGTTNDYYVYVSNKDATNILTSEPAYKFSDKIKWTIICGPISGTISEGPYPTTPITFTAT